MNINRHNYEAFFLLYVDNELSTADKKAVELFVQQNADLKEELQQLLQTVTPVPTVVFEHKEILLKHEIAPLEEQLLLFLDNELSPTDNINTQQLLKTDTGAAAAFELLQQTKLQPNTAIVFPNKKILYRNTEGKLVRFPWKRIAAAAILLGFGTWITVTQILNNTNPVIEQPVSKVQPKETNPSTPTTVSPATNTPQPVTPPTTIADNNSTVEKITEKEVKEIAPKNNPSLPVIYKQGFPAQKNNNSIAVQGNNKKPGNNLPKPDYNNFNNNQSNESIAANVPPTDEATENKNSGNKTAAPSSLEKAGTETINGYALNTQFTEGDAEENNNNKVLYMDEDKVKKTRLGGFFRKVKRLVERNTNVKTGNGIKVAAFDIAIK
jgi:hypothetical protein